MKVSRAAFGWISGATILLGLGMVAWELGDRNWEEMKWKLSNSWALGLSYAALALAFGLRLIVWKRVLDHNVGNCTWALALESRFKPILAKYVPGKIWLVISSAACLESAGASRSLALSLAGWYQALQILSGVAVGALGALFVGKVGIGMLVAACAAVVALLVALVPTLRALAGVITRSNEIVTVGGRETALAFIVSAVAWGAMGLAYWQFLVASGVLIDARLIALVPLANVIGMLTLFAPGGLGVRESTLAIVIVWLGVAGSTAASVALWSRPWFVVWEGALFALGIWAGTKSGRQRSG